MTQQIEKEPIIRTEKKRTHQGQAVKTILELLGQKPDILAEPLHITPRQVFTILQKESIQPKKLKVIAEVLEVPVKLLENFDAKDTLKVLIAENCKQENSEIKENAAVAQAMISEKVIGKEYTSDPNILESYERLIREERKKSDELFRDNILKELKIKELEKALAEKK